MKKDGGKLAINEERDGKVRISWWFSEEGEFGASLGDQPTTWDSEPSYAEDPEGWECYIAEKTVEQSLSADRDSNGFYWERAVDARKVLRAIKTVFRVKRPLPDWAHKALAANWKPPKGWKP